MVNQNYNRNMGNCGTGNCGDGNMRNNMCCAKNDKQKAMCRIYELGFVLTETMLFLDTHPDDQEALNYYTEMKEQYKKAVEKYADYYGPLNMTNMSNENYWMWVATPMPWEMEDC